MIRSCFLLVLLALSVSQAQTITRVSRERWVHERQQAGFVPHEVDQTMWTIDSVIDRNDRRSVWVNLRVGKGVLVYDRANRLVSRTMGGADHLTSMAAADTTGSVASFTNGLLPELRLAELSLVLPRSASSAGATWIDTVEAAGAYGAFTQRIRLIRRHRTLGDTVLAGRRHWIVRDSAVVEYTDRASRVERTARDAVVDRNARGTTIGRTYYDADSLSMRARSDTTVLEGTKSLRYADGRVFRTTVRFDGTRRYFAASADPFPEPPDRTAELMTRMQSGDLPLRDSLLAAWDRSRDPDERATLEFLIRRTADPAFEKRMDVMAVAAGDLRPRLEGGGGAAMWDEALTVDDVTRWLPFMRDPGLGLAYGIDAEQTYENLIQGLTIAPPVATRDTMAWSCLPSACRLLAAEWDRRTDERLRDVALVVRFTMNPRDWADSVRQRAATRPLLREAAALINGGKGGFPPAGAPGTQWAAWFKPSPGSMWNTSYDQPAIIRFQAALTGRNISEELRRMRDSGATDADRAVSRNMLLWMGEYTPVVDSVVAHFRGGQEFRTLARSELMWIWHRSRPADDSVAVALIDRLLAVWVGDAALWPTLAPPAVQPNQYVPSWGPYRFTLTGDSMPPGIRDRWTERLRTFAAGTDTVAKPPRSAPVVVSGICQFGAFASITFAGAGRSIYWLMRTETGWVIVASEHWSH